MSEKAKKPKTAKKSSSTKKTTSSSTKKPAAKSKAASKKTASTKTSTTKKAPAKKTTTTKKPTTTKKATTTKKTITTKKPAAKTKTTKKPATTKSKRKPKMIKAKILGYKRNNRLQTTNQAIAKILDDYNHKALLGKRLVLKFPDSDKIANATIVAVHGQPKNRQVRIRFLKKGMAAAAINQIAEIYL